jgi:drug/metabolite transporter (DMT)-like permease
MPTRTPRFANPIKAKAYAAWATVCVVWGTTYLAIRIALETIPPLLMGGMRYITAGALLAAILKMRGERLPEPRAWPSLIVMGMLLIGLGNGGVVWAEQTVTSGLTAVLVATSPFWMVGIDALTPHRGSLGWRKVVGLMVGFSGIVLLVWPQIGLGEGGRRFLGGVIAAQVACVGWAVGSLYSRRRGHTAARDENVLATAAFQMLFGGMSLLVAGLARGEASWLAFTPRTALALAHLTLFGAVAGFAAYAYALKHLPIATMSLYAYINPVIAVVLGALLLKEPFTARMGIAAAIVLGGIALVRTDGQ